MAKAHTPRQMAQKLAAVKERFLELKAHAALPDGYLGVGYARSEMAILKKRWQLDDSGDPVSPLAAKKRKK
jgi:hypothetical protein